MNNIPKTIFLDLGEGSTITDDFNDLFCVTWSADNATGYGVEYRLVEASESDEQAKIQAEADEKAEIFVVWYYMNRKNTPISEQLQSPEFLAYYEERRKNNV